MKKIKFLFTLLVLIGLLSNSSKEDNEPSIQTIQDYDGNQYETVEIGEQTWMKENLKTTTYKDGSEILNITSSEEWLNTTTGGQCAYDNSEYNVDEYGRLYNWYAVETQKLCPEGWHVPSDEEWTELENYLIDNNYSFANGENDIAKSLAASKGWDISSEENTPGYDMSSNNSSGFSGIPAGARSDYGNFAHFGKNAYWWTSSVNNSEYDGKEDQNSFVWRRRLSKGYYELDRWCEDKGYAFSVRCVKG